MPRSDGGESVLSRAVRVVESFDSDHPVLTVSEIARRSGLHVATASRLVEALVSHGWLVRAQPRGVRLGLRLWEVASRTAPTLGIREAAMPVMQDLQQVIGHHIQLAVLQGDDVLIVERLTAPDAVINYSQIAGRLSAHASSSGIVLLAHAPQEIRERILAQPLARYTDQTITDPAQLRQTFAEVRRRGYALLRGHLHPDAAGIAVPIRESTGTMVAALSIVVPNDAMAASRVAVLQSAALSVSRAIELPRSPTRPPHKRGIPLTH